MSRLLFLVSFLILAAGGYLAWSTVQTTKVEDTKVTAKAAFVQEDWGRAARGYEAMTRLRPKDAESVFLLAFSHHKLGRYEDALVGFWQALKLGYNESLCLYDVACAEARLGRKADAMEHLVQAVDKGFKSVTFLDQDEDLAILRGEPAYKALLAKMKGDEEAAKAKGGTLMAAPPVKLRQTP